MWVALYGIHLGVKLFLFLTLGFVLFGFVLYFTDNCFLVYCSWWQYAANLASYEQQDAHEFFISMLDGIHEKVEKDGRKPGSQG